MIFHLNGQDFILCQDQKIRPLATAVWGTEVWCVKEYRSASAGYKYGICWKGRAGYLLRQPGDGAGVRRVEALQGELV